MNVEVRPATARDAVEIASLLAELGYPIDATQVASRLHAAMDDRHFVLVADTGSELIGVLSAAAVPLLAEATTMVRITSLSVTASARRRGVAAALVDDAERRAIDMGAAVIEVGSGRRPERAAAHRFYPALGFEDANEASARYWKWLNRDLPQERGVSSNQHPVLPLHTDDGKLANASDHHATIESSPQ